MEKLNKILKPEQQAVLDDELVKYFTSYAAPCDQKNLEFLKNNFSAEDLVKIQQNNNDRYKLADFMSGEVNINDDQKKYNECLSILLECKNNNLSEEAEKAFLERKSTYIKNKKFNIEQRIKDACNISQENMDMLNNILRPEQQAALDDEFVRRTLTNGYSCKEENLKVVADKITARKLVDIQQNESARIELMNCILGRDNYGLFNG